MMMHELANLKSDKAIFIYSLLLFIQFIVPDDALLFRRNMLHE